MTMFVSHFIWFLRTRHLRKRAACEDVTFDTLPEAVEWQERGFDAIQRIRGIWKVRSAVRSDMPSPANGTAEVVGV